MDVRLRLERRLESLNHLAAWVESYAQEQGLSPRAAFQLDLVLAEAVANIVEHGGGEVIELACQRRNGDLHLELRDDGPAYDPTLRPPPQRPATLEQAVPGGLGVHLMRQYTRELLYRRDGAHNLLTFSLRVDS